MQCSLVLMTVEVGMLNVQEGAGTKVFCLCISASNQTISLLVFLVMCSNYKVLQHLAICQKKIVLCHFF